MCALSPMLAQPASGVSGHVEMCVLLPLLLHLALLLAAAFWRQPRTSKRLLQLQPSRRSSGCAKTSSSGMPADATPTHVCSLFH